MNVELSSKSNYCESQPLVSVCVVTYNHKDFVQETLDSIKYQSYENIELIISDDHSVDGTYEVIENWCEENWPSAKVYRNEENVGICANMNRVVSRANGEFLSFLGSDDRYLSHKTARQVELLCSLPNEVAAVYSDAYIIDELGKRGYSRFIQMHRNFMQVPSGPVFKELLAGNFIPAMSVMLRKNALEEIGHFDEKLRYEDYDYWLRLSKQYHMVYDEIVTVEYRLHSDNYHKKFAAWGSDNYLIYAKHLQEAPELRKVLYGCAERAYLDKDVKAAYIIDEYRRTFKDANLLTFCSRLKVDPAFYRVLRCVLAVFAKIKRRRNPPLGKC